MQNTYSLKNLKTHTLFEISDSNMSIGRSELSDICINDTDVSRDHAKIYKSIAGVVISDLGSTNGTRVNGKKITEPTHLMPGDVIQIGFESFKVLVEDHSESTVLAKAPLLKINPVVENEAHRFRFSDLLHLFPFSKHISHSESVTAFGDPDVQSTIEKYLAYFGEHLNGQSALALFLFKEGKPLAIQCITPLPNQTEWTIGRGDTNYIMVEDPSVSKKHAKILHVGSTWMLSDEDSTNGLRFNGHKEKQIGLVNGMVIYLGDIALYVRILHS